MQASGASSQPALPTPPGSAVTTTTPWGGAWPDLVRRLAPTSDDNAKLKSAFAAVKQHLNALKSLAVVSVLKAGSWGKGTILRGRLEIDVVVYLGDFSIAKRDEILTMLSKHFGAQTAFGEVKKLPHSIGFKYQGVEIDLLPTKELPRGAIGFLQLATAAERDGMSASAARDQCAFIKGQCSLYKDLVLIAKHWRDQSKWDAKNTRPASYLLELLMLRTFQNMTSNKPGEDPLQGIFRQFLIDICDLNANSFVCWNAFYNESLARAHIQSAGRPVVMDVANPTNNVASRLASWDQIVATARGTLKYFDQCEMAGLTRLVEELQAENKKLRAVVDDTKAQMQWLAKASFTRTASKSTRLQSLQHATTVVPFDAAGLKWQVNFLKKETWRVSLELLQASQEAIAKILGPDWQITAHVVVQLKYSYHSKKFEDNPTFNAKSTHLYISSETISYYQQEAVEVSVTFSC